MRTPNYKPQLLIAVVAMLVVSPIFSFSRDKVNKKETVKWVVQKTSSLRINGKTNIAGFGCDITGYYQNDTILYSKDDNPNKIVPLRGALNIGVNNFDCHNKMLTNDLRKTLKAKEHPNLVVRFVALERMPVFQSNKDIVKGWVEVELAGAKKRFDIAYCLEKKGDVIMLNGAKTFCFTDFNLVPPQKFGGVVKVKNEFDVNFRLILNQVD